MGEVVATYPGGRVLVGDLFSSYYSVDFASRPYVGDQHGIRELAIDLVIPELETQAALDMGMGRSREAMWAKRKAREDYLIPLMEEHFRSEIIVTDEDLADYYDKWQEELKKPARHKISRILSPTAAEAKRALRRLEGGEDFLQVSKEISEVNPTAEASGELGWLSIGFVPAFDSALAELDPGEITGVFESGSGFEILRLEGREDAVYLSFDEAVPEMKVYISNSKANEALAELVDRKKREVGYRVDEELLRNSEFPLPERMARNKELDKRQEDPRQPVLPRIDK
jgi:parvulin-like peptidyl-prolyl isomerase